MGILQVRLLEWVAVLSSREVSRVTAWLPGMLALALMAESEEELKSFLMKVKEESENFGL